MENKEFSKHLENRTKVFSIKVIQLSSLLPKTEEGKVVKNQFTKSGTSIGANYREANRSRSKADFLNKIKICESETSEVIYWLEIITELDWITQEKLKPVTKEATELLAIFTSVVNKLKIVKS
jgi:four helix bundle protein